MKLRVKSDEPCTSKVPVPALLNSPASPVGRIAKRNACLLNGLDLKNGSSFSGDMVGTILQFNIRAIQEAVPALQRAVGDPDRVSDVLDDLQSELEVLLAENVDSQKNISGEVSFLTTGDYPTDDLSHRPMPMFDLRDVPKAEPGTPVKKKKSLKVFDVETPTCSKLEPVEEEDAGSDVASSMDETETEEPYCVLDIPHRFWTWAREYIGHIDAQFLKQFETEFYQRYTAEKMAEYFVNEPFKHRKREHLKNGNGHVLNGIIKKKQTSEVQQNGHTNGHSEKSGVFALMKNLMSAYVDESNSPPNKKQKVDKRRKISVINGDSYTNGLEPEEEDNQITEDERLSNMASVLTDCFGPVGSEYESEDSRDSFLDSRDDFDTRDSTDANYRNGSNSDAGEEYAMINVNLDGQPNEDAKWDDVSLELLKAQKALERLMVKTTPILEKGKRLLEAEHSHWVTEKNLNKADEELFEKAGQLSVDCATLDECGEVWRARQLAFIEHHIHEFRTFFPHSQDDDHVFMNGLDSPPRLQKH